MRPGLLVARSSDCASSHGFFNLPCSLPAGRRFRRGIADRRPHSRSDRHNHDPCPSRGGTFSTCPCPRPPRGGKFLTCPCPPCRIPQVKNSWPRVELLRPVPHDDTASTCPHESETRTRRERGGVFRPIFALAASGLGTLHCPHLPCVPLPRIGSGPLIGPTSRPSAQQHRSAVPRRKGGCRG